MSENEKLFQVLKDEITLDFRMLNKARAETIKLSSIDPVAEGVAQAVDAAKYYIQNGKTSVTSFSITHHIKGFNNAELIDQVVTLLDVSHFGEAFSLDDDQRKTVGGDITMGVRFAAGGRWQPLYPGQRVYDLKGQMTYEAK